MNILDFPAYLPIFRGKRKENNEWVEGLLSFKMTSHSYIAVRGIDHLVYTDTLSIATGLKDANGKMIYEGDILDFRGTHVLVYWNGEVFQWQFFPLMENESDIYCWFNSDRYNPDLGWVAAEVPILGEMTTKIIGNKWDNPELIPEYLTKNTNETVF